MQYSDKEISRQEKRIQEYQDDPERDARDVEKQAQAKLGVTVEGPLPKQVDSLLEKMGLLVITPKVNN